MAFVDFFDRGEQMDFNLNSLDGQSLELLTVIFSSPSLFPPPFHLLFLQLTFMILLMCKLVIWSGYAMYITYITGSPSALWTAVYWSFNVDTQADWRLLGEYLLSLIQSSCHLAIVHFVFSGLFRMADTFLVSVWCVVANLSYSQIPKKSESHFNWTILAIIFVCKFTLLITDV